MKILSFPHPLFAQQEVKLTPDLADGLGQLQQTARDIAAVSAECKIVFDAEEYVQSFRPTLMDVVYQWSKGASFGSVCQLTDVFEGSIIR